MSNITLSAVTKAIETLESMVRAETEYITIAEMLDIAHIAEEGALGIVNVSVFTCSSDVLCLIVATGGLLMEAFLQTSSNYVTRRAWRSVMQRVRANPDYDHKLEVEEIVTEHAIAFIFTCCPHWPREEHQPTGNYFSSPLSSNTRVCHAMDCGCSG